MMPLGLLSAGEKAEVVDFRHAGTMPPQEQKSCCGGRVEDMGLRAGKVVEMLNNKGKGAILIKVDGTRIALGRGVAMKVMVKK